MILGILVSAVAAVAPTAPPPFPVDWRELVTHLPDDELRALRQGAFDFCRASQRSARWEVCMALQDSATVEVARLRKDLAGPHRDRDFIRTALAHCDSLYSDHERQDVRILEECLGRAAWVVRTGDQDPANGPFQ